MKLLRAAIVLLVAAALSLPDHAHAHPDLRLAFVDSGSRHVVVIGRDKSVRWAARAPISGLADAFFDSPSWAPDGRRLAYGASYSVALAPLRYELRIVDVDNGARRTAFRLPLPGWVQDVAWSPNGKQIAFVVFNLNPIAYVTLVPIGSHADLFVMNSDGTGLRPIAPVNPGFISEPVWSPDSTTLAFTSNPNPAGIGVARAIYTVRPNALAPVPHLVSPPNLNAHTAAFSPDGRRLAFVAGALTKVLKYSGELWVSDVRGRGARRVAANVFNGPAWSPDSEYLAITNSTGVFTVHASGPPRQERIWTGEAGEIAWSRDGELAFVGHTCSRGCGIFLLRPGGTARALTSDTTSGRLVWSR